MTLLLYKEPTRRAEESATAWTQLCTRFCSLIHEHSLDVLCVSNFSLGFASWYIFYNPFHHILFFFYYLYIFYCLLLGGSQYVILMNQADGTRINLLMAGSGGGVEEAGLGLGVG